MRDQALERKLEHILRSSPAPIEDSNDCVEQLYGFAELVAKWNKSMNLVSEETTIEIINNHVIDSLYASFHLPEADAILDIGSGAGFPGIPLAILRSKSRVILIESRQKPVSFLKEAKLRLKLKNLEVVNKRIEELSTESLGLTKEGVIAVSRAYSPAEKFFADLSWVFNQDISVYYLGGTGSQILSEEMLSASGRKVESEERYYPGEAEKRIVLMR